MELQQPVHDLSKPAFLPATSAPLAALRQPVPGSGWRTLCAQLTLCTAKGDSFAMGANSHSRLTSASILIVKLFGNMLNPRTQTQAMVTLVPYTQPSCLLESQFLRLPRPSKAHCDSPARGSRQPEESEVLQRGYACSTAYSSSDFPHILAPGQVSKPHL